LNFFEVARAGGSLNLILFFQIPRPGNSLLWKFSNTWNWQFFHSDFFLSTWNWNWWALQKSNTHPTLHHTPIRLSGRLLLFIITVLERIKELVLICFKPWFLIFVKISNNHKLGHLFFIGSSMKAISSSELGVWSLALWSSRCYIPPLLDLMIYTCLGFS
jgi:hypothetical protein